MPEITLWTSKSFELNRSVFLDTKCALISFQLFKIKQAGMSLSGHSVFISHKWLCLPVTLFHCPRQSSNCSPMCISIAPPSSPMPLPFQPQMLQQKWGKSKESPSLSRTKMNCVRVQSFVVAWHEITALGFCQGECQLVNYNSGRQDWDKQKIQWQLLHRTILSGLVNTKIHCVNKDRQLHYAIVCYYATAKEQVLILENRSRHSKLICSYTWDD